MKPTRFTRSTKTILLAAGVATGVLGLLWFRQLMALPPTSWRRVWRQALTDRRGEAAARQLLRRVDALYASLKMQRPLPVHPILRWHVADSILPGLALYQALLEDTGNREAALSEVEVLFRALTQQRRKLQMSLLNRVPFQFEVFRLAFRNVMRQFPAEGWDITMKEQNNQRIAFDIHRCFYLDTLTAYGAPELTASFCKGDDVMAEMLPPSIRFRRTTTLGRGGSVCDFGYERGARA